jgi:DNA-binding HxlR family transcriptional regulator
VFTVASLEQAGRGLQALAHLQGSAPHDQLLRHLRRRGCSQQQLPQVLSLLQTSGLLQASPTPPAWQLTPAGTAAAQALNANDWGRLAEAVLATPCLQRDLRRCLVHVDRGERGATLDRTVARQAAPLLHVLLSWLPTNQEESQGPVTSEVCPVSVVG